MRANLGHHPPKDSRAKIYNPSWAAASSPVKSYEPAYTLRCIPGGTSLLPLRPTYLLNGLNFQYRFTINWNMASLKGREDERGFPSQRTTPVGSIKMM